MAEHGCAVGKFARLSFQALAFARLNNLNESWSIMTFSLSSPITGLAQTGLTSPTYTLTSDTPPNINSKQWVVSALGGTQTGVVAHSVSAPFSIAMFRPQNPQVLAPVNPVTGVLTKIPTNTYKVVGRKGVLPLAGQAYKTMTATLVLEVPAGADTADAANVRALLSAMFGAISQQSAGIGDTSISGTL